MGDLVKLQFALIQWVMDTLSDREVLAKIIKENNLKISDKPFTPVLPPMRWIVSSLEKNDTK
jgi:seryl-tRNA synthetase